MFYPWSALLPGALVGPGRRRRGRPQVRLPAGLGRRPWLVLECFQTKLIHYYLPAFPACALLVAWLVVEASRRRGASRSATGRSGRFGNPAAGGLGDRRRWRPGVAGPVIVPPGRCSALAWRWPVNRWLRRGDAGRGSGLAERGVDACGLLRLVTTWAVVMALFVAWLLPFGRALTGFLVGVVGERLGSRADRTGRPTGDHDLPGAGGGLRPRPSRACDVRGYDEMADEVAGTARSWSRSCLCEKSGRHPGRPSVGFPGGWSTPSPASTQNKGKQSQRPRVRRRRVTGPGQLATGHWRWAQQTLIK